MKKRIGIVVVIILALAGLADATYILQHEISGTPLLCSIGSVSGCTIVTESSYAYIFGIPVAEYGVFFYGILFVLTALELFVVDTLLRRALVWISGLGVLASLYFTGIQFFVIHASCLYCLLSTAITVLIFFAAVTVL